MSSSRVQDAELINKVNYSSIYYQWSTYNSLKNYIYNNIKIKRINLMKNPHTKLSNIVLKSYKNRRSK